MNNASTIKLNNHAIAELQEGNITMAYELLIHACKLLSNEQNHPINHFDMAPDMHRFGWCDCTKPIAEALLQEPFSRNDTSSVDFMYLKFLVIDCPARIQDEERGDGRNQCPCEFAWAIWYNTGILSGILACLQKMPNLRQGLLEQALSMFTRAERRVDQEPPSKHWSLLSLSISNNQACVLRELCMDDQTLDRLVKMGLKLTTTMSILNISDVEPFHWTIQLLSQANFAPAA